ncbi:unnamed protein product, partial [Chrysoparadoxa australica]
MIRLLLLLPLLLPLLQCDSARHHAAVIRGGSGAPMPDAPIHSSQSIPGSVTMEQDTQYGHRKSKHPHRTKPYLRDNIDHELLNGSDDGGGDEIMVIGAPEGSTFPDIGGVYQRSWDVNGRPHYCRSALSDSNSPPVHLYWANSQWNLHYDLDPSLNMANCLAYSKAIDEDPVATSRQWFVKAGSSWVLKPRIRLTREIDIDVEYVAEIEVEGLGELQESDMVIKLTPLYACYILDSICSGIVLPALPFFVMSLGGTALHLSIIVSANYIAQTFGCLIVGPLSDRLGRRPMIVACLAFTAVANLIIAGADSLKMVALGRVIGSLLGGMTPTVQAAVADIVPLDLRPKFIGRIQASVGAGFVTGPVVVTVLSKVFHMSPRGNFAVAVLFPLIGLVLAFFKFGETKKGVGKASLGKILTTVSSVLSFGLDDRGNGEGEEVEKVPIPRPVLLLVMNGFLLMYAFSIETVYAMFLKDNFGFGASALSTLFALNGVLVGILQLVVMKHLVGALGKHVLLVLGNLLLGIGMLGLGLMRFKPLHFALFSVHIIGYSMADTALVSLITRYADEETQGRSLSLNTAAQSAARVVSPLVAGVLYERSRIRGALPLGALPYVVGSLFPLVAIAIPFGLYCQSVGVKKAAGE